MLHSETHRHGNKWGISKRVALLVTGETSFTVLRSIIEVRESQRSVTSAIKRQPLNRHHALRKCCASKLDLTVASHDDLNESQAEGGDDNNKTT